MSDKTAQDFALEAAKAIGIRAEEDALRRWKLWTEKCESEIERVFVAGLMDAATPHFDWNENGIFFRSTAYEPDSWFVSPGLAGDSGLQVWPQAQIGDFRVDFAMHGRQVHWNEKQQQWCNHDVKIIVECDGHDFHERTKEQAERDRSRDRELTLQGFVVVRFTGREIWRDPSGCGYALLEIISAKIGQMMPKVA